MQTQPPGTHWTVCWIPGLGLEDWANSDTQLGPEFEFHFQKGPVFAVYTKAMEGPG